MSKNHSFIDNHLKKASQNFDFYIELCNLTEDDPDRLADWKITVLFYTAAHMIHAYIAFYSEQYSHFYRFIKHSHCKDLIEKGSTTIHFNKTTFHTYYIRQMDAKAAKAYRLIKDLSEQARYMDQISSQPKLHREDVRLAQELLDDLLSIFQDQYQINIPQN